MCFCDHKSCTTETLKVLLFKGRRSRGKYFQTDVSSCPAHEGVHKGIAESERERVCVCVCTKFNAGFVLKEGEPFYFKLSNYSMWEIQVSIFVKQEVA